MNLVTHKKFSELCGLALSSVDAQLQAGKPLHAARIGRKIDLEHPAAIRFIEDRIERHTDPDFKKPQKRHRKAQKEPAPVLVATMPESLENSYKNHMAELAADMKKLSHLTLNELIFYFGEDIRFLDWLKAIRLQEKVEDARLKNAERDGTLVLRKSVHVGVLMVLDSAIRGMLTDGAKTIATKTHAMAKAGRAVDEIEEYVVDILGSYLKPAKAKMSRNLKGA